MLKYDLSGELSNYTGHDLVLVNNSGTVIRRLKSQGKVTVDIEYTFLGWFNNRIEMSYDRVVGIRGLPAVKQGKYLVVTGKIARAAALTGRTLEDLLVPDMQLKRYEGNASEVVGYLRLIPAIYYCQSV